MRSDPWQQIYTMHRINMSDLVYLQATIPIRFCKTFYLFAVQANFLAKVFESAKEVRGALRIVEMVKGALREDPIQSKNKGFTVGKGLLDQIFLMILNLQHPKQVQEVTIEADTPLLSLKTPEEAVSYLDAVIRSGTSSQEKSGTVFLMGNTGVHTPKKQTN